MAVVDGREGRATVETKGDTLMILTAVTIKRMGLETLAWGHFIVPTPAKSLPWSHLELEIDVLTLWWWFYSSNHVVIPGEVIQDPFCLSGISL